MTQNLLSLLTQLNRGVSGEPREASTRSAGAQPSEGRTERKGDGEPKPKPGTSETVMVNIRLRRPIVEAVAVAIEASPIEFGNAADFYRRAIEHELQRRGLLKTYR